MITLTHERYGYTLSDDNGLTEFIQTDWEYPYAASYFGWQPCTECRYTDGTVNCEHRNYHEMLAEAGQYLDDHDGDTVPGDLS